MHKVTHADAMASRASRPDVESASVLVDLVSDQKLADQEGLLSTLTSNQRCEWSHQVHVGQVVFSQE